MSTKPTKRKRASAPKAAAAAPTAEVVAAPSVEVAPSIEAAPSVEAALIASAPEATTLPTIALASNCTVKDAAALKNGLLQLLDEPGSVSIDAKSVERIDTAIMQLLCAFVRDRKQRSTDVAWLAAPQPLLDAARLLGVGELLCLPREATP